MNTATTEIFIQILIVDDEENILRSLKRLLTNEEFEVLTAISGEEALKILSVNPDIALIVSDQRMPGLSGVEFLEQAKSLAPDATRIILTGYADVNAAIDGINMGGAYRYITKPWNDEELLRIVNEAVLKFVLIKDNQRLTSIVKKQNEELKEWNSRLEATVQEQTLEIRKQNEELRGLNESLGNNFKNTILAFSGLIELRDERAASHSRNVAELSIKIAKQLGLSGDEIQTVSAASLLHDIGKIGIPDILLTKDPDEMKPEETAVYSQHPVRGQTAIDSIEALREVGTIIRHHHECFNGGGFPDKLTGESIPIGARIISIADFIDRTIRKLGGDKAVELTLKKVKEELGKRFDGRLYPLIETPARDLYDRILQQTGLIEMELNPKDLRSGMILSKDVISGTGILILRKGMKLHEKNIDALRRSYQLDPSASGIFVMIEK
ncbi:MAG TPA: response regulator [Nitrospirae bacterium]|nr:cyclic di-GMP phosphodiesterase response regulator RpfG [bacterium BMS3Abin06]HDH12160.1 response regulator [Nitrospirota bacterium]HDZ02141.1 response regulator [Nitrospirota bacterium]